MSTKGSVDYIRRMKAAGIHVTAETCPQYFTLTEEEIEKQGAMAKVNPPLRTRADVEAILEGLEDGTLEQWVWLDDDEPFYDLYDANWMHVGPLDGWSLE